MATANSKRTGVLATAEPKGHKVRLVLEDAALISANTWAVQRLFTHAEFDASAFGSGQLSEKELADIGLNVVVRLAALAKA
jgi:hypothetical protein